MRPFVAGLLLLGATFASAAPSAPTKIRFTDLRAGDTLQVYYWAVGCWDSEGADFTFSPEGHGRFAVTEHVRTNDPLNRWQPMPRGFVFLEAGECAKLDRLLDCYRTPPAPDAVLLTGPMIPAVRLRLVRGRRIVAEEQLQQTGYPGQDLLTFGEMLQALRVHAKR